MSTKEATRIVDGETAPKQVGLKSSQIRNEELEGQERQAQIEASNPEFRLQKPTKARPRACRPTNPSFDSRQYVEIVLTFSALKNFDLKEVPLPGQYVIRASCMGKIYGHFVSKSVDIHAIALFSRTDTNHPHCPDINIDEELFFYIRFKELIDNPILISLCDTTGSPTTEYEKLTPIGYICLDVAQILDFGPNAVETHVEPWIIIDPGVQKKFLTGQPMLKLAVECQTGMPTSIQLKQGNMMTVVIESMSCLPEEVVQNASDPADSPEMQVIVTLPHSEKEPFLDFTGGKLNVGGFIEPPLTTLNTLTEATQTVDFPNSMDSGRFVPTRHWASVRNNWTDLPQQAAAASTAIQPEMEDATEVFGDAVEAYTSMELSQEPLVSWNTQHKKYIQMESYKKMLTRLSQDVVWPLEVVVTTQRPNTKKAESSQSTKFQKKKKKKRKNSEDLTAEHSEISLNNETGDAEDSEILYMNELGRPTTSETVVVYHGIAFVDLSRLVYPGVKKVRFACRLFPFSQELLMSKTCLTKSAFAEILQGVSSLTAYESSQHLNLKHKSVEPMLESSETATSSEGLINQGDNFPFIVFEINLTRAIIPLYKTPSEIPETVHDYIPRREIPRRKLITAGVAQQKFRRAVLEAAAEVSAEYTNHYWKEVVQGSKEGQDNSAKSVSELKKGFVFYLNASGRYLILREHLRQAVSQIVQQRCLNLRPSGFQTHRDFQSYLHDMYTYLVDEIHETLSRTLLQEVDPLDPAPEQTKGNNCSPELSIHIKKLEQKTILRELLFYAEESFAQGDFDNCHRLHLQRICRSKEAPQCWLDFAIMWLSRGDDRMAEIAVREALRSDPKNIHALTIAGVIAVRHNDERGIDCLSTALSLKPSSPEILVILAVSLATVNNEMGSDYFFRKAAYLHRTFTGQETGGLDKTFDNISKTVGVKQSVANISKAQVTIERPVSPVVEAPIGKETAVVNLDPQSPEAAWKKHHTPRNSQHPKEYTDKKKSSDSAGRKMSENRKLSSKGKNHNQGESLLETDSSSGRIKENVNGKSMEELLIPETMAEEEDFYTKRDSISGNHPRKSSASAYQPRFDFDTDLANINVDDAILPPLRPSLILPWNVTEPTEKLKPFLEAADNIQVRQATTGGSEIAADEIIKAEYDKIVQGAENHEGVRAKVVNSASPGLSKPHGSKIKTPVQSDTSQKSSSMKTSTAVNPQPKLPVYINRVGSELIWTAYLLLQMRMFDMLDGVLARELYVSGLRSIEFLYLRAMSLYLRQSQAEAVVTLEEAVQLEPENAVFWMIKGHCHYEIGQNAEAMTCYETALRLPVGKENRHLLYLRYGSLSMDGANSETAKKVFMHGIQKYPTPYMWLATGNTCYLMGDYDEAESSFTEANRLDNTNPTTWAHLALINLAKDQQALAEQSYKWALRFGLKKGKIMEEIKRLQEEKGFGDPSFPRVPNCIPHDYYVRRLGRQRPFDIYRDALMNEPPTPGKTRFQDSERETELKRRLKANAECGKVKTQESEGAMEAVGDVGLATAETEAEVAAEPIDNGVIIEEPVSLENDSTENPPQLAKSVASSKLGKIPISSTTKQGGKANGTGKKSVDRSDAKPRHTNQTKKSIPQATGKQEHNSTDSNTEKAPAAPIDKRISAAEKNKLHKISLPTK